LPRSCGVCWLLDEERSELKTSYVRLPAPTIDDWNRTKKHRVFAMRQQYRLRAEPDGPPAILITYMSCLKAVVGQASPLVLFAAATFPVRGRVCYRVPARFSVSTGYRATVAVALVGRLETAGQPDGTICGAARLLEVRARVSRLDIANDPLNAARAPIEDLFNHHLLNHHLRRRRERIRHEADEVIRQAFEQPQLHAPLAPYPVPPGPAGICP